MSFNNPFDSLRMRNALLAGPQRQTSPTFNRGFMDRSSLRQPTPMTPQQPRGSSDPYFDEFLRLQNQPGPAVQAYRDHLDAMPNREDYRPGWMTRIAAALSGLGAGYRDPGAGVRVAQDINMANYNTALTDYSNRGLGLQERARIEQDELDTRLKALQQARAMGLEYDKFELARLQANAKMDVDQQNANANLIRAQAAARPGYEAQLQQDGSILYVNRNDPTDSYQLDAQTVAAGQLGVARQNAATNRMNATTSQGNLANSVRRTNIYERSVDNAHTRGLANIEADKTRPVSSTDQINARALALEEFMSIPEFSEFIEAGDGPLTLKPPPTKGWFESEEEFAEKMENYEALIADLQTRVNSILMRRR